VHPLGGAQLGDLGVDDLAVHRLGDAHVPRLARERHQRQPVLLGRVDQRAGQLVAPVPDQLDHQAGGADPGQVGDVPGQRRAVVGQRDAGRQHQLAAAQQVRDVGDLGDVRPAHRRVQPGRARDDVRAALAQHRQREHLGDGRVHGSSRVTDPTGSRPTPERHGAGGTKSFGRDGGRIGNHRHGIGRDRLYGRDAESVHVVDGVRVASARTLAGDVPDRRSAPS
jgi:hypothetical protein